VGQLASIHSEMSALSKGSPNDGVNKFKLEFINAVITRCNKFLGAERRPFKDFETFDPDAVMSNSDVTFMVSMYTQAIEKYRSDHITMYGGDWYYETPEQHVVRTAPPGKIKDK
jgi:hypothetical protein